MREYFYRIITDQDQILWAVPIKFVLSGLSFVYGWAVGVMSWCYRAGFFKTKRLEVPVISVGNITSGGTGKTPLTAWITRYLQEK